MAKDDEDGARGIGKGASLAGALREPIAAGSLEAALRAARAFHQRKPGDGDAKRVVEALELLMSEVWLGADEEDARYADAAASLDAADLAAARAGYTAILRADPSEERASRLALRVDVVRCARAGAPLPPAGDDDEEELELELELDDEDSTRIAGGGELPLEAFAADDETVNVDPLIPPEAFPDEPTRQVELGDYELIEDADGGAPSERGGPKETTRVAQPGELPLEQLRREMKAEESDADLDLFLDAMESDARAAPAPPPPPVVEPRAEPSLELDIDDELDLEGDGGATEVAPREPRRRTPSRSFPRPEEAALARSPSRTFARPTTEPPEEPVLSPPPIDDEEEDGDPSSGRYAADSSAPPPAPVLPRADELNEDAARAKAPTGEVAAPPSRGPWDIREPGGEPPPAGSDPVLDSWSGVRIYQTEPATFEPGVEGVDADSWEEATQVGALTPVERAEAAVSRGDLGEALRIYQDLATQSPDDQRLWDRVAEIARMLQQRSGD